MIAVYDVDNLGFPNYALMQVSSFYKNKGEEAEHYLALNRQNYSLIYASSCFDFSDKSYVTAEMICGGTGFQKFNELPFEIQSCEPDYSIYPNVDFSIVWFDMGCFRKCPFCLVHKLGPHREVDRRFLNPIGKFIKIQDDQFFYGRWNRKIKWLEKQGQPVDIQNVDARTFKKEYADALSCLDLHTRIKMAWDNPKDDLKPIFEKISKWIKPWKIMVYVLIGYWSNEKQDLERVETLRGLGFDPYIMPFNKNDPYQKRFARWVNHKAIFKSVKWKDYN